MGKGDLKMLLLVIFIITVLSLLFIASIIVLLQGNIYSLLFIFIFGAIIIFIIVNMVKGYKESKSETRQDEKPKNQITEQISLKTQRRNDNRLKNGCVLKSEGNIKMKDCKCRNCYYCDITNHFFTRWCSYWNTITFLTGGCSREITIADDEYFLDSDDNT